MRPFPSFQGLFHTLKAMLRLKDWKAALVFSELVVSKVVENGALVVDMKSHLSFELKGEN